VYYIKNDTLSPGNNIMLFKLGGNAMLGVVSEGTKIRKKLRKTRLFGWK
jgi:hypothetical protein